ncbi:alpha/beta hydrolase [Paraburkholderia sp. RL17-337-BIB-A]|uniref:alpha/beta hydrolase n=1 Tax=Paraburkholderia sp. RL17-337-BIB-A TaxID=3031636 RepID=UPI0038B92EB5
MSNTKDTQQRVQRRRLLQGAALTLMATAVPLSANAAAPQIIAEDHWAQKGAVKLYLYRKRLADDRNAKSGQKPVLFLVHGSSFSGRGGFDLHVPGTENYSFMDEFARYGFDVWTMDHENYGRSSQTDSNSDVRSGVEDLKAAMPVVERVTGQKTFMFYGQSSGALRLGVFAMEEPDRVERMVLDAITYTGEGAPEIMRRRENIAALEASNFRPTSQASFDAIFARDDPSTVDPKVPKALGDYELKLTNRTPNGTYIDMAIHMPMVDPKQLQCPVCMTRAEHDGNATDAELLDFFSLLPNKDKQFCEIKGVAHIAVLGINRHRIWHAMHAFFTMPPQRSA